MKVFLSGNMIGNLRENGKEVICNGVSIIPSLVNANITINIISDYEYSIIVPFDELIKKYFKYLNEERNKEGEL